MRFYMLVLCACVVLGVSTASAHGPQIQITVDTLNSNKIVTRQMLPGNSYSTTNGLTAPAQVYVMPVVPVSSLLPAQIVARVKPHGSQTFGPGFTYGYDQTVGSTRYFTANLGLHLDGLKVWDGSAFVATLEEEVGVLANSSSNTNADTITTTPSGIDTSVSIAASYAADEHSSFRYTLKVGSDSTYGASDDGIYLLALQLSGTQSSPTLAASDPFYFILNKGMPYNDLVSVVNSFASSQGISSSLIQYAPTAVPEPGTAALVAAGVLGIFASSTRRRRGG